MHVSFERVLRNTRKISPLTRRNLTFKMSWVIRHALPDPELFSVYHSCYSCLGKAFRKAQVQKEPNKTYYNIGSNVNLTCEAEKNTNLYEIVWYKLDSQRTPIELKSALNGPGILTLTLNSLTPQNSGIYMCVVSRPQVNYYNSQSVNINVEGRTF